MIARPARLWPDSATILERSKRVFLNQWEDLLRLKRQASTRLTSENIHDLRVASRRFRAALELFYPFVPKGAKTDLRKSIRKLARSLDGLRNIDEACRFFTTKGHLAQGLCHRIEEQRSSELERCEKALKGFYHNHFNRQVLKMVAGINESSITERNSISLLAYFSDVSIRQYMPIHEHLAGSTVPENRSSRHALRIAIKRWCYFFEIVAPVLDRDYSKILEQLKEYHNSLK